MTKIEKNNNFRRLYKQVMKIAENGMWEDLVAWRREFYKMRDNNELLKGDAKILDKNELFAERQIKFHKHWN